jgi:hypothetical protein
MQFVAYYIDSNGFGTKNQTVNLGGKYFYTLTKRQKEELKFAEPLTQNIFQISLGIKN